MKIVKMSGRKLRNVSVISLRQATLDTILLLLTIMWGIADQENAEEILGEGSNAIVWPKGPSPDDEDLDEVERFANQRLMRLGTHLSSNIH